MNTSRTRIGIIAPCIGVGGGDALMLGLIKYAHNLEFTGLAIYNPIEQKHYEWAANCCGVDLPPIHTLDSNKELHVPEVNYHEVHSHVGIEALKGCDIILTWCVHTLNRNIVSMYNVPIIEYAQNSDDYAKKVITSNLGIPHYYAACSKAASNVLPDTHEKTVIYNGIDPGRVAPRIGRDRQRAAWGLQDRRVLLYMGRFVEEKHPEKVLAALLHLPDDWVAVFVGRGYQESELYKQAQIMCPDRTFFVDPQYHVGDFLAAADVFILPSDFEGHSLALCEAWLAGTPTVFTDFAAMAELEERFGALGTMVSRRSGPDIIASAVMSAASGVNEISALTANARSVVWENFTLTTISAQWEEYIDWCLFDWRKKRRTSTINGVKPKEPIKEAH